MLPTITSELNKDTDSGTYKNALPEEEKSQMDRKHPSTLQDYCSNFNISFFDLRIPCIFCGFILTTQHLAGFVHKNLSLVWRGDSCFACCLNCCRLSAKFELSRHYQCSVLAEHLEVFLGKPLSEIIIRCCLCLKHLDLPEKIDTISRSDWFHLVRCQWKGYCRDCVEK